jgi:signal transduction histidine kinase
VASHWAIYRDNQGKPISIIEVNNDITGRRRAEEALRETRDYLENLFGYANAPIIVWDPGFRITRFNHAFERLTGFDAEKVIGEPLEHQPLSLKQLIEEAMDMVAVEADHKGLNLAQTISYRTPDTIIGDHGRLRQILVNLLSNAVKFTDKGDVSVSVSSKPTGGHKRQIRFSVKDTGIGISQVR